MAALVRVVKERSGVVSTEEAARPPARSTQRNSARSRAGSGNSISPRLHTTASKSPSGKERACPSSTAKETFGSPPRRRFTPSSIRGERSAAMTWPVGVARRPDRRRGGLGEEAGPGGDVEHAHARREAGHAQQGRGEVARDAAEHPVVGARVHVVEP